MFRAQIKNTRLHFPSPTAAVRFQEWKQAHEGRWIVIDLEAQERTLSELRMYRAWLNNVCEHSGNDPDSLHELLLERCAPTVVITIKGPKGTVEREVKKRTSGGHKLTMDKHEMSDFMAKCAELTGYPLPTEEEKKAMGYISNY